MKLNRGEKKRIFDLEDLLRLSLDLYNYSDRLLRKLLPKDIYDALTYESNALLLKFSGKYEEAEKFARKAWEIYFENLLLKKAFLVAKRFDLGYEYLVRPLELGIRIYSFFGLHEKVKEFKYLMKEVEKSYR